VSERQLITATPTEHAEAYRTYLQGRDYHSRPGNLRHNLEIAQQLYERAVALDPEFAIAHSALSEVHGIMHWFRYDPSSSRVDAQYAAATVALRLQPDLPQGHLALGLWHYFARRDYHSALAELEMARRGLPNDVRVLEASGWSHRRLGNWDMVFNVIEKAVELDPRETNLFVNLAGSSFMTVRRYSEALHAYDRALELAPDLHAARVRKGQIHLLWKGELDSLRAAIRAAPTDANLGFLGTRLAQEAELLLYERRPDSLLKVLQGAQPSDFDATNFYLPPALWAGWAHQLRRDQNAARAAFATALSHLDSVVLSFPNDWRVRAARGLALAGLERREAALAEAEWLANSLAYRHDEFDGPTLLMPARARILAQAGEANMAIEELQRLVARPSWITSHVLRLEPIWDPIRADPRFARLAAIR
jgi:tetratricopeptide (TPR) repeat protein